MRDREIMIDDRHTQAFASIIARLIYSSSNDRIDMVVVMMNEEKDELEDDANS